MKQFLCLLLVAFAAVVYTAGKVSATDLSATSFGGAHAKPVRVKLASHRDDAWRYR